MILAALAFAICPPPPAERVTCVHDGDTAWIAGEKVRIADIDTPELNGECPSEKALARRARDRLVVLLNEDRFTLRREGEDRFGRTLAVVVNSRGSVGDRLVAEGLARTWTGRRESWCDAR